MRVADYLLHLRPKSWPIVFLHCAVGGELALARIEWGWPEVARIAAGAAIWAVLLNGGTLAFNSAFDDDEGDIGYLDNPPKAPPGLAWFGFGAMVLGAALAWWVSHGFYLAYACCFILSILYSMPPLRLKAVAGFDLAINMVGYGALTVAAGYFAAEELIRQVTVLAAMGFGLLFGALYPLTQIYQIEEDARKGARGLTVRLGARRALLLADLLMGLAFANFIYLYFVYNTGWLGAAALLVSFGAWMWVLIDWSYRFPRFPHKQGMYRALGAWAVTEGLLAVIWLEQIWRNQ